MLTGKGLPQLGRRVTGVGLPPRMPQQTWAHVIPSTGAALGLLATKSEARLTSRYSVRKKRKETNRKKTNRKEKRRKEKK